MSFIVYFERLTAWSRPQDARFNDFRRTNNAQSVDGAYREAGMGIGRVRTGFTRSDYLVKLRSVDMRSVSGRTTAGSAALSVGYNVVEGMSVGVFTSW